MAKEFKKIPIDGMDLDSGYLRIPQNKASFIKGFTFEVNKNANTGDAYGRNKGVLTPIESNVQVTMPGLPSGNNRVIGFFESKQKKCGYVFVWNSDQHHLIYRINYDQSVDLIYSNSLLNFQFDPKNFISEGRCASEIQSYYDKANDALAEREFICFTDNINPPRIISVNDSLATSSFTTTYFNGTYDRDLLIAYGVPTPLNCIGIDPVTPTDEDIQNQNLLINKAWQFRVKFVDVYGRESEHGIISENYITIVGGGCISTSNDLARCVDLTVDAGIPLIDKIVIEYRIWQGNDTADALYSNWNEYETIEKYDNSGSLPWYQRAINPYLIYSAGTNKITYRFCGDKQQQPVSPIETARLFNPIPLITASMFSLDKTVGLANNVRGFEPIDPAIVNKVDFGVEVPDPSSACPPPRERTIVIYAFIYRPDQDNFSNSRSSHQKFVWGGADGSCGDTGNAFAYDCTFEDQANPGFIGYFAGTQYSAISERVFFNTATGADEADPLVIDGPDPDPPSGFFHAQKFIFKVPEGVYLFRIASHRSTIYSNYQGTSTYVAGTTTLSEISTGSNATRLGVEADPIKEFAIDCTSGDKILNQPTDQTLVIYDPESFYVIDGYLKEDPLNNNAVEMNPILFYASDLSGTAYGSYFTDHNGFYFCFATVEANPAVYVEINSEVCDGSGLKQYWKFRSGIQGVLHGDGTNTPIGLCGGIRGMWSNPVYLYGSPAPQHPEYGNHYPDCGRRYIIGRVATCDDSIGVPGISALLTKSQMDITSPTGYYEIITHNRYNYIDAYPSAPALPVGAADVPDYSISPFNIDTILFTQRGSCSFTECGTCNYVVDNIEVTYISCAGPDCGPLSDMCTVGPDCTHCRITDNGTQHVSMAGVNISGVQSGGRYPVGFMLSDNLGRCTFVQAKGLDAKFVDVPPLTDYKAFLLSKLNFTIDPTVVFPTNFKTMTLCVGANTKFEDYFTWVADYVQPVNSSGEYDTANPSQIRIYYQSLNEYNKANNNSTNNNWEFIAEDNEGAPVVGDVVEFISNLDGTWLPSGTKMLVTYDSNGAFFTVDYNSNLANLSQLALFRIIRPIQNQPAVYNFYEQCLTIPLVNGVPQILSGIIPYTDSYLLSRVFPVPVAKGNLTIFDTPTQFTSTANNSDEDSYSNPNNNKNGVIIMSLHDSEQGVPYFFESPSPSDLWGSHCANRGRINVINPYERQTRRGGEIALGDDIVSGSNFNGLCYFEDKNIIQFDQQQWGNISCVIAEIGTLLVLCEFDHFIVGYRDSDVNIGTDGNIIATTPYGVFNRPQRRANDKYGCQMQDINTIRKKDGIIYFFDRSKRSLIRHDFAEGIPVEKSQCEGYFLDKVALQNQFNGGEEGFILYFIAGIDPLTGEYCMTSQLMKTDGEPLVGFLNEELAISDSQLETIVFDVNTGLLKSFVPFAPEYYGANEGAQNQKQLFTFVDGGAWIHHGATTPDYMTFYNIICKRALTLVFNPSAEKVKKFLYNEVYCKEQMYVCDLITTESGQQSHIGKVYWDKRDNFYASDFKCDINTYFDPSTGPQVVANAFLEGNTLYGRWMQARYVSQDQDDSKYSELSGVVCYIVATEKSAD